MRIGIGARRAVARGWCGAALVVAALLLVPAIAHAQFQLGLQDPGFGAAPNTASARTADAALNATAGSVVRVGVDWASVAPAGSTMPAGFDPSNPADPQYRWGAVDAAVRAAAQLHARVLLTILDAPRWAQGPGEPANPAIDAGAWDPSPSDFAQFAHAAAVRYSGDFPDPLHAGAQLPRVNYWEIWNEENLPIYLAAPDLVSEYRSLLNAGYGAIKAVHRDNVIVFGGLAPVSFEPPLSAAPLQFAAAVLCLHRVGTAFRANASCPQRAEFDVFAHHPYSLAATPTKHAYAYDNVLVGDMGKIATLVHTADRLHTDAPAIHHRIWVTEWAWFTNPPDQQVGDAQPVAARYVAYSMYEMWKNDVSLVVWQTVLDAPGDSPTGAGLYASSGQPKLTLRAFAFPVVAAVSRRGAGLVWGRAPVEHRVQVVVEHEVGRRWLRLGTLRTASDGVFQLQFPAHGNGLYRAQVVRGPTSLAYNSTPIPRKRTHEFFSG